MDNPVVETYYGCLFGSIKKSIEGYKYYAFKGIPYAKPPINELRFEDPQPPEKWKGIKQAIKFGPPCAQFDQIKQLYVGSEDCLYLNIYTKSIKTESRLPVMMWIHGGAFSFGSGDDLFYGPDYLLKQDIILVTINYRLGIFGFLNLEDEIMPGNQGMKDQVMALKWIQRNIANFGGDPNNVTVFGESSGGACAHYLALSKMTKGLIHKIICESGTVLTTWASLPNPKQYAYSICKILGNEMHNSIDIVKFLKTINNEKLVKAQEKLRTIKEKMQLLYPFLPGVDEKSVNPFMPIPLTKALENGIDIPFLLGYNNREGIYSLSTLQNADIIDVDINFDKYTHPNLLNILKNYNLTLKDLRKQYDCLEIKNDDILLKIMHLMEEMYISLGFHQTIKVSLQKNLAPMYFYIFSYDKGISLTKLMAQIPLSGASHFDEVPYLFYLNFFDTLGIRHLQKGTESYRIMEKMIQMWTNFATTGNPTPSITDLLSEKWTPVTNSTQLTYMNIDTKLSMNNIINLEQQLSGGKTTSKL